MKTNKHIFTLGLLTVSFAGSSFMSAKEAKQSAPQAQENLSAAQIDALAKQLKESSKPVAEAFDDINKTAQELVDRIGKEVSSIKTMPEIDSLFNNIVKNATNNGVLTSESENVAAKKYLKNMFDSAINIATEKVVPTIKEALNNVFSTGKTLSSILPIESDVLLGHSYENGKISPNIVAEPQDKYFALSAFAATPENAALAQAIQLAIMSKANVIRAEFMPKFNAIAAKYGNLVISNPWEIDQIQKN